MFWCVSPCCQSSFTSLEISAPSGAISSIHGTSSGLSIKCSIICTRESVKYPRRPRECCPKTAACAVARCTQDCIIPAARWLEDPIGSACARTVSRNAPGHTRTLWQIRFLKTYAYRKRFALRLITAIKGVQHLLNFWPKSLVVS